MLLTTLVRGKSIIRGEFDKNTLNKFYDKIEKRAEGILWEAVIHEPTDLPNETMLQISMTKYTTEETGSTELINPGRLDMPSFTLGSAYINNILTSRLAFIKKLKVS